MWTTQSKLYNRALWKQRMQPRNNDGSEKSLENSILVLKVYAKVSGLECNIEKTRVVWFGSKKGSTDELCKNKKFNLNVGVSFKFSVIVFII